MSTGRLLAEQVTVPEQPAQCHPMDSSRVLLGLMALCRQAAEEATGQDPLEGVISAGVLKSLLSALHFRDVTTVRHSRRVALLALGIARHLGWEGRHLKVLEVAALMHDIGKIGVPDNVLFKPGALSPDEAELMSLHHNIGVDVLQACRADSMVLDIVGHARSFYNGATEGFRRIGSDVPMGARILAVADAYDSLATDQVYRKGKPHEEVMEILSKNAGTQFDGNIVNALNRWAQNESNRAAHTNHGDGRGAIAGPAPGRTGDALQASSLCHIFSYLYVLESLYDGFYLVDSDLRFVVWNRGAEKLLGLQTDQMLGKVWTSRVLTYADKFGKPRADLDCPMHQVISSGRAATSAVQIKHADGNWKEVEVQSVPLVDEYHRLQGCAEIFRDLSRNSRKPQEYRELRIAASRDPLTSVANRGELETQLGLMVSEFLESGCAKPFSVIFLDVDHFKSVNDGFGHTVGDVVLVEVARMMQHETYSGELVGRYGGEEFVVLCPDTDLEQAIRRAERLRIALTRKVIPQLNGRKITASFGVAQAEAGESIESILRRADKALYMAKENGRNQTRSLTNAQLLESSQEAKKTEGVCEGFLFHNSFYTLVAADMLVYKLGGYVTEFKAKLLEVAPKRALLRVGTVGLIPFWGATDDKQPVEIDLTFGDPQSHYKGKLTSSPRVEVTVKMHPLGWIKDPAVFQARAKRAYKDLRSYFAAEND
jgi:diguanylate cyclase (GGDEF)-like protein/PAS domain S-box-containing protein/putative nucleotidyltransferase with HDIG domain